MKPHLTLLFTSAILTVVAIADNPKPNTFGECLARYNNGTLRDLKKGTNITKGGLSKDGDDTPPGMGGDSPLGNAVSLTYPTCVNGCGPSPEKFDITVFSKQFSAWLLPWLALVSQLPYGAELRKHHIITVFLTVGSPTLAAYSLIMTVLNGHYLAQRFARFTYPNASHAIRILSGLQQSPLRIISDRGLLASLIVLPENDKWWANMARSIDYEHTWSISALANISWVIIAYFFTVAESFSNVKESINANGQGVGGLWLWLLPIVVGWLQISPKCNHSRLHATLLNTNESAYIATRDPDVTRPVSNEIGIGARRAFMFDEYDVFSPSFDDAIASPIFNYSRIFSWIINVERVANAFEAASMHVRNAEPVNEAAEWRLVEDAHQERVHVDNRRGTLEQVTTYCTLSRVEPQWRPKFARRVITASVIALLLQWATTTGAVIVVWFTPTTGLGCRSGAYLLYGIISTLVWGMMLASSILAHYAKDDRTLRYDHKLATNRQRTVCKTAIILNGSAKVLAGLNTILIIAACVFQFSNVFNNCYCNSSVLGRGWQNAFFVIDIQETSDIITAWGGGVALSAVSCFLFIAYVQTFLDVPQPPSTY